MRTRTLLALLFLTGLSSLTPSIAQILKVDAGRVLCPVEPLIYGAGAEDVNHEIYGGETSLPWGFRFVVNVGQWMQGAEPIFTAPCHPTQIYEAAFYLLTFAICMLMYWRWRCQEREGLIFGVFMLGIFVPRFFIEYIKNVQEPWEIAMRANIGLDQGQLLSIPFILLGIWLIVRALRRPRVQLEYPDRFADEKKK